MGRRKIYKDKNSGQMVRYLRREKNMTEEEIIDKYPGYFDERYLELRGKIDVS